MMGSVNFGNSIAVGDWTTNIISGSVSKLDSGSRLSGFGREIDGSSFESLITSDKVS